MPNPADIARALSEYWMPIETADRNEKVPIIVEFNHGADPYYDPADPNRLTDYAANAEGGDFLGGAGVAIAIWRDGYHESDGWESGNSYWMPGGWFAYLNDDATDYAVNATRWMPLPEFHRPTANDASTDRTPATVDGCGKEIE